MTPAYPVPVRFTREQAEALSRLAESTGKPVAALVREAVEQHYAIQSAEVKRGRKPKG